MLFERNGRQHNIDICININLHIKKRELGICSKRKELPKFVTGKLGQLI